MIWKYVAITAVLITFCAVFIGINLGLDWVAENYADFYEWMTLGSGACMFGGFIAEAFMVLTSWHVAVFMVVSFPMLHRAIWRRQQKLHEKAEAYDREMNTS